VETLEEIDRSIGMGGCFSLDGDVRGGVCAAGRAERRGRLFLPDARPPRPLHAHRGKQTRDPDCGLGVVNRVFGFGRDWDFGGCAVAPRFEINFGIWNQVPLSNCGLMISEICCLVPSQMRWFNFCVRWGLGFVNVSPFSFFGAHF